MNELTDLAKSVRRVADALEEWNAMGNFLSDVWGKYIELLEHQQHLEKCRRVLVVKMLTLGLTKSEKDRLNELNHADKV